MHYAIIAAGEGSRLAQEGVARPKPLVELNGEPMILRLINIFTRCNAQSISIIINDFMPEVKDFVKSLQLDVPLNLVIKSTPSSMHSFWELSKVMAPGKFCLTTVDTIFREEDFARYIHAFEADTSHDGMWAVTPFIEDEKPLYVDVDSKMNIGDFPSKRVNLFVEEPELSLFPDNQVGLIDFMVDRCFISNTGNYDITLMLSTHSPYIVNYLNVLLHRPQTEVHLDREQLGVYRVYNGTIQDLMLHGDNPDDIAVDTRDLSETMQTIYNEYVELASTKG